MVFRDDTYGKTKNLVVVKYKQESGFVFLKLDIVSNICIKQLNKPHCMVTHLHEFLFRRLRGLEGTWVQIL